MNTVQEGPKTVVVAGDITVNWNLARSQEAATPGQVSAEACARLSGEYGAAAQLARLLAAAGEALRGGGTELSVHGPVSAEGLPNSDDERFHHTYAVWARFREGKRQVWRLSEPLGIARCTAERASAADWLEIGEDTAEADVVVLDDAGLGFRNRSEDRPQALSPTGNHPWVVLRMVAPVAQGPLWQHLREHHADRLIVLLSVDDLRRTQVQISRELSWERTAQDVFWELANNPRINSLSRCAHVVVSFGAAGAILLSRLPGSQLTHRCQLLFDPGVIEGVWEEARPGGMVGTHTCLTAGLACAVMRDPQEPDVAQGIQSGLVALRTLYEEGYEERGSSEAGPRLAFPVERIARVLVDAGAPFDAVEVQDPVHFLRQPLPEDEKAPDDAFWTILQDHYRDNLNWLAERIVLAGPAVALKGVPLGRFGHLLTVDRREIESFSSIRSLVAEYCRHLPQKRPLSIAVFGSPGSGKSFGITQVADSLLPGRIEVVEFNLSQFGDTTDLGDALHQVRDVALSGKIPLVFWDEFDTSLGGKPLGWLRYFLAPMQDGRFQEGQLVHPIGSAIFVFAGGTSARMNAFGRDLDPAGFRAAKGPDFVSRLKGYVDIQGPNRQGARSPDHVEPDPYYVIRRAIILRSLLQRNAPQLFDEEGGSDDLRMDPGVLRAFLRTREYKHGVRSMEAIMAMSLLAGSTTYERSCLPSEAQLDLHVDGQDFLALVQRIDLEGGLLETLAATAHQVFLDGLTEEERKTHRLNMPYEKLPEHEKEQNRGFVQDIPRKLALAGYVMIPARSNESPFEFPRGERLELLLAQLEHKRWMALKEADGWQPAQTTNRDLRRHASLIPWDELPQEEKDKDLEMVRRIPVILAGAGYAIVEARKD